MNYLKILNIIFLIFSILLALGKIIKAIQTKMNMNIPIVPENFMINIISQDIAKVIIIFCVFLFQLKLYRAKKYLFSILLYIVVVLIYNTGYFFL
ncbi:hypothetical protein CDL10_02340 [Avrilella dinanensis]|uniref:DUF5658 domain-containing protein n=1 Tax=Avrilella dinanensis TaxID=2008672 RepID=A0A2M9R3P2_9FLAO|nr:hypothetical protein CDL10_02340 [Avrilella dinanensis]